MKITDRTQAVKIGQTLMFEGFLAHVCNSEAFADHFFFYQFIKQEKIEKYTFSPAFLSLYDEQRLSDIIEYLTKSPDLEIKRRRYLWRVYDDCFIGYDLVTTLLINSGLTLCQNRQEAVQLGRLLLDRGAFHHVLNRHNFEDSYLFYRFYHMEKRYTKISHKSSVQTLWNYLSNVKDNENIDTQLISEIINRISLKYVAIIFLQEHPILIKFLKIIYKPFEQKSDYEIDYKSLKLCEFLSVLWYKSFWDENEKSTNSENNNLSPFLFVYSHFSQLTNSQYLFLYQWLIVLTRGSSALSSIIKDSKTRTPTNLSVHCASMANLLTNLINSITKEDENSSLEPKERKSSTKSKSPSYSIKFTRAQNKFVDGLDEGKFKLSLEAANLGFRSALLDFVQRLRTYDPLLTLIDLEKLEKLDLMEISSKMPKPVSTLYSLTTKLREWTLEDFSELIDVFTPSKPDNLLKPLPNPNHPSNKGILGVFLLEILFTVIKLEKIPGSIHGVELPINGTIIVSLLKTHPEIKNITCFYLRSQHLSSLSEVPICSITHLTIKNVIKSKNLEKSFVKCIQNLPYLTHLNISSLQNSELHIFTLLESISNSHRNTMKRFDFPNIFLSSDSKPETSSEDIKLIETLNLFQNLTEFAIKLQNSSVTTTLLLSNIYLPNLVSFRMGDGIITTDILPLFLNRHPLITLLDLTSCTMKIERLEFLAISETDLGEELVLRQRMRSLEIQISFRLFSLRTSQPSSALLERFRSLVTKLLPKRIILSVQGKPS